MIKIKMKWAWNPEDIGGRRLILVQVDRLERTNWRCLTDAIQALSDRPQIERVKRTANDYVHTIKFDNVPDKDLLKDCQRYIETIYEAKCEGKKVQPANLKWKMSEPLADRLDSQPKKKPPTLKELLKTSTTASIHEMKDDMVKQAITRLDKAIEDGEMTEGGAYKLLKSIMTGAV